MTNILLVGALGNIGFEVLKQLCKKRDLNITILDIDSKKNRRKIRQFKNKINVIFGSIYNLNIVKQALKNQDIIIHLAAIIPPFTDRNAKLSYNVNYVGTKNIVHTIKENNHGFLLFASSIAIYGDRLENPYIQITDKLNPQNDYYAKLKIMCEEEITNSGIDYSIFRLTAIMGMPTIDPLMFHMPLNTKMEIASSTDTARAFVNAIYHINELNKKIFNLSGGTQCRTTYQDFLKNMFNIYGFNFKYINKQAFANYNFHCGYYLDGDKLEDILHFRKDSLNSYYLKVKSHTNKFIKFLSRIFSKYIMYFLQKKSEPLLAKKTNNQSLIKKFFK